MSPGFWKEVKIFQGFGICDMEFIFCGFYVTIFCNINFRGKTVETVLGVLWDLASPG